MLQHEIHTKRGNKISVNILQSYENVGITFYCYPLVNKVGESALLSKCIMYHIANKG